MEWKNKDQKNKDQSQCTMEILQLRHHYLLHFEGRALYLCISMEVFQNLQPNEMDSHSVDILPIETGNIVGTY